MRVKIKQHDYFDCGAVCLASICAHYNQEISIAKIRQYANTDKKGTTVFGLVEACKKLNFLAKGVKGSFDSLSGMTLPVIAHVNLLKSGSHFIVIYKVTKSHVKIMDPEDGEFHLYTHQSFIEIWTGVLVVLSPNADFVQGNFKSSKLRYFVNLISPHKKKLVQILFGALIYTLLGLTTSIFIQKVTDYVFPDRNFNLLNILSLSMIVILLLQSFIGIIRNILSVKMGQLLDLRLILGYYKHLLSLPQIFFDNMRVGEIVSRINDAVKIRSFINDVALNIFLNACIVCFSIFIMFVYYWKLALVMLIIIPVYVVIYLISDQINKKQQRDLMVASAELEAQLVESLNAISTIKRFRLEEYINFKTETRFVELLKRLYKNYVANSGIGIASDFFTKLFTILLFWVGGNFALNGSITPGELFSFYSLLGFFTGPIASIVTSNKQIQEAMIATDRLFEIMQLENEDTDKIKNNPLLPSMIGDIRFESVNFRYGSRGNVFNNFSITIPKGKISAIVGDSGSGKSTLVHLLQNIYPLNSGHIFIGNFDLKYITNDSLRHIIGVVPQKIDLFAGTIIENIAIGEFEYDMPKLVEICQSLGILDFIDSLPSGFYTYIGENGTALSGGQKQRIAIARAIYKDPEILILDEASSSLDAFSNDYVKRTLNELRRKNKTIIMITHRLSSIQGIDKIFYINNGLLVEEGSHNELINLKGYYYNLWNADHLDGKSEN